MSVDEVDECGVDEADECGDDPLAAGCAVGAGGLLRIGDSEAGRRGVSVGDEFGISVRNNWRQMHQFDFNLSGGSIKRSPVILHLRLHFKINLPWQKI